MSRIAPGTSPRRRNGRDTRSRPIVTPRVTALSSTAVALVTCALGALCSLGCSEAKEAERVELSVVTDGALLEPVTTDLGYTVEVSSASMVADDLKFTVAGEAHVSLERWLWNLAVPEAHAHPGHYQGGEITGELPGHFVLRFVKGEEQKLGTATLLVGDYHAVNLTLATAASGDAPKKDPLLGHTAAIVGTATKDSVSIDFEITLDSPKGRELVGIPFEEEVTNSTHNLLALRFSPLDPLEMDTLFDGIDFGALDTDGDGNVSIAPSATDEATVDAYNLIHRTFQTHDHLVVQPRKK